MEENKEGNVTPSFDETREVMDELRAEGYSFEGDAPKEESNEEVKVETPETPKEAPKEEPKEEPIEEEEPQEVQKRTPRMKPEWQVAIEKKRLTKEMETESAKKTEELYSKINDLQSQVDKLKGTNHEKKDELEDEIDKLITESGADAVDADFVKKLTKTIVSKIPKHESTDIPDDVKEALKEIAELKQKAQFEKEDMEYNASFKNEVVSKLKEEYPQIDDSEIDSIREKMKSKYFSEKYVNLSAGEVYELTKSSYKDMVSPEKRKTVETGTRGVSRTTKQVDYSNMTEEDYKNLSDEELEEANAYILRNK